jgi:hypothetical protein
MLRAVKSRQREIVFEGIEMEEMGHVANTVSAVRDLISIRAEADKT